MTSKWSGALALLPLLVSSFSLSASEYSPTEDEMKEYQDKAAQIDHKKLGQIEKTSSSADHYRYTALLFALHTLPVSKDHPARTKFDSDINDISEMRNSMQEEVCRILTSDSLWNIDTEQLMNLVDAREQEIFDAQTTAYRAFRMSMSNDALAEFDSKIESAIEDTTIVETDLAALMNINGLLTKWIMRSNCTTQNELNPGKYGPGGGNPSE